MKRNITLLSILTMMCLLIFTNVDHFLWLNQGSSNQGSLISKIFPLIINNIIWLCLIPLFLIWKTKKELSNGVFILMLATVFVQLATTIYSRIIDDPLAAGLPFVIVTIPISIMLLIFATKELQKK